MLKTTNLILVNMGGKKYYRQGATENTTLMFPTYFGFDLENLR